MSMHYMLDTNICIYLIKRQPRGIVSRLESLRRGEAVMSAITYAELRTGLELQDDAHRANDEQALALVVESIPVLPFGETAAASYGVIRAAVRERNRDALDRLIAAHALSVGATLVTNNEADFRNYPGLRIENWAAAAPV